jgi:hypothetical protein
MVHLGTERLLYPERHIRRKRSPLIQEIGECLPRDAKRRCRIGNGETEGLDDLAADKATEMGEGTSWASR